MRHAAAGAARAAGLVGDRARAKDRYAELLAFCDKESTRPEVRAAQAFLEGAPLAP